MQLRNYVAPFTQLLQTLSKYYMDQHLLGHSSGTHEAP